MALTQVNPGLLDSNAQYTGFKNRIINGAMVIDQRNAGAAQSITVAGGNVYTIDRWQAAVGGATVTGQRVAGSGNNQYNYRFTGAASATQIQFWQKIESNNCYDLAGTTVTLSANLANSLLTTVTWYAFYANATDTWTTSTQIATGTFTVNSTLTQYTTNISIPAAATTGIQILFLVGAQISGTWTIGNVQLEKGSTATSFDYRPYGTELQLCQRYYQQWGGEALVSRICMGTPRTTTQADIVLSLMTPMRTAPTYSSSGNMALTNAAAGLLGVTSYTNDTSTSQNLTFLASVASGLIAGNATQFVTNNDTAARFKVSAEL